MERVNERVEDGERITVNGIVRERERERERCKKRQGERQ